MGPEATPTPWEALKTTAWFLTQAALRATVTSKGQPSNNCKDIMVVTVHVTGCDWHLEDQRRGCPTTHKTAQNNPKVSSAGAIQLLQGAEGAREKQAQCGESAGQGPCDSVYLSDSS